MDDEYSTEKGGHHTDVELDQFRASRGGNHNRKANKHKGPYILGKTLGEGAFGKVKVATHIHTKEKVAIKILDKTKMDDEDDIKRVQKEINILKKLRHKNIIQLYEIMESKKNLYIVMEYCEERELFDHIVNKKRLTDIEACKMFQEIIDGVEYLHSQNITHRDLKPENLLLDWKKCVKISDFGLSTHYDKDSLLQTPCGTPSYAPPEMLKGEEYHGLLSDMWSCGIILYAMLCGFLPFAESKEEIICQRILEEDYEMPDYLSDLAVDLLKNILKVEPSERYDIAKVKEHPWFNLTTPSLRPGLTFGLNKIPIDSHILELVEDFGYSREKCKINLENNKYDSVTSIYYLCLRKYIKNGGKSISDMVSDDFLIFFNNPNNILPNHGIENVISSASGNIFQEETLTPNANECPNTINNEILVPNDIIRVSNSPRATRKRNSEKYPLSSDLHEVKTDYLVNITEDNKTNDLEANDTIIHNEKHKESTLSSTSIPLIQLGNDIKNNINKNYNNATNNGNKMVNKYINRLKPKVKEFASSIASPVQVKDINLIPGNANNPFNHAAGNMNKNSFLKDVKNKNKVTGNTVVAVAKKDPVKAQGNNNSSTINGQTHNNHHSSQNNNQFIERKPKTHSSTKSSGKHLNSSNNLHSSIATFKNKITGSIPHSSSINKLTDIFPSKLEFDDNLFDDELNKIDNLDPGMNVVEFIANKLFDFTKLSAGGKDSNGGDDSPSNNGNNSFQRSNSNPNLLEEAKQQPSVKKLNSRKIASADEEFCDFIQTLNKKFKPFYESQKRNMDMDIDDIVVSQELKKNTFIHKISTSEKQKPLITGNQPTLKKKVNKFTQNRPKKAYKADEDEKFSRKNLNHKNKFMDISATYDPDLDSKNESSVDRSTSRRANLRNLSFSPDIVAPMNKRFANYKNILKKAKKQVTLNLGLKDEDTNDNNDNVDYLKASFTGNINPGNQKKKDVGLISEDEELRNNFNVNVIKPSDKRRVSTNQKKLKLQPPEKRVVINLSKDKNYAI
jgi:serine/threonine protein kinase